MTLFERAPREGIVSSQSIIFIGYLGPVRSNPYVGFCDLMRAIKSAFLKPKRIGFYDGDYRGAALIRIVMTTTKWRWA